MTKLNIIAIFLATLVGSHQAEAANLRLDRQLVEESMSHAQRFRHPTDGELRRAEDKLLAVQRDLLDLRVSLEKQRLENSLDSALRALRDRRLPDYLKADAVLRSGQESLAAIEALQRNGGDRDQGATRELTLALTAMDRGVQMVLGMRIAEAQYSIRESQNILRRHNQDRDIQLAAMELDHLQLGLGDRRNNPRQLALIAGEHTRIAREAILRSRAYRDDNQNDDEGRELLGRTHAFNSRVSTTDVVTVGRQDGRFSAIILVAKDANIRVEMVEVIFGNGRSEVFSANVIKQGERLRLDIRGKDRFIRQVRITARTGGDRLQGQDGFLVVRGVQ